jgi:hypothetical protein
MSKTLTMFAGQALKQMLYHLKAETEVNEFIPRPVRHALPRGLPVSFSA